MVKRAAYLIMLAMGIAGVLEASILPFYTSINLGILLPGIAGIFMIIHSADKLWWRRGIFTIRNRTAGMFIKTAVILSCTVFAATELLIVRYSAEDRAGTGPYLLLLGAGLKGSVPSQTLKELLAVAASIAGVKQGTIVIVSGGKGLQEELAEAMRRYLVNAGIGPERILSEERAASTAKNIANTPALLHNMPGGAPSELDVVTSGFHALRTIIIARRFGVHAHVTAARTPNSVIINCYLREFFALAKTIIFD